MNVALVRELHRLQDNDVALGFTSSGYSSRRDHDLPSARRLDALLAAGGRAGGASYFALGGSVSDAQIRSTGMREDAVHMKGPTELLRDDLATVLPYYMVPRRVVVLDAMPLTEHGKVDLRTLARSVPEHLGEAARPEVAPRTPVEARVGAVWTQVMEPQSVSVLDDFFDVGGNSLHAVALVNGLRREFGQDLPMQLVFEHPTVEELAAAVDAAGHATSNRLVALDDGASGRPVFCWPGLGGYPMSLRPLAAKVPRPVIGIQARGINPSETPLGTVDEMAAADVELLTARQPCGPYTLWGYSFGARVAFESAYLLERAGETVDRLVLIAPGNPRVPDHQPGPARRGDFADPLYVAVLYSVFTGTLDPSGVARCRRAVRDERSFVDHIVDETGLDPDTVRRITGVVRTTYAFEYTFAELERRRVAAPITVVRARGDDYSFIDASVGLAVATPTVVEIDADHYGLLRGDGLDRLVEAIASGRP